MRDWEESLREVQRYYSFGQTAKVDMAYMREKYREIKKLVEEEEAKALKLQSEKGKVSLKQELRLHLEEMALNRGSKNQSVMLPNSSRRSSVLIKGVPQNDHPATFEQNTFNKTALGSYVSKPRLVHGQFSQRKSLLNSNSEFDQRRFFKASPREDNQSYQSIADPEEIGENTI